MKHSVESFGDLVVCDDPPSLCPNSLQLVQHCKKRGISEKKVFRRANGHTDKHIWKEKVILIGCFNNEPKDAEPCCRCDGPEGRTER